MHKRMLKHQGALALALLLAAGLAMSGCGKKKDSAAGCTPTNSASSPVIYTNGDTISELTAIPPVPSCATIGGTFTVNVPVDADTGATEVGFWDAVTGKSQSFSGKANGSGTIPVTVTIPSTATAGKYIVGFAASTSSSATTGTIYRPATTASTTYNKVVCLNSGCTVSSVSPTSGAIAYITLQ